MDSTQLNANCEADALRITQFNSIQFITRGSGNEGKRSRARGEAERRERKQKEGSSGAESDEERARTLGFAIVPLFFLRRLRPVAVSRSTTGGASLAERASLLALRFFV